MPTRRERNRRIPLRTFRKEKKITYSTELTIGGLILNFCLEGWFSKNELMQRLYPHVDPKERKYKTKYDNLFKYINPLQEDGLLMVTDKQVKGKKKRKTQKYYRTSISKLAEMSVDPPVTPEEFHQAPETIMAWAYPAHVYEPLYQISEQLFQMPDFDLPYYCFVDGGLVNFLKSLEMPPISRDEWKREKMDRKRLWVREEPDFEWLKEEGKLKYFSEFLNLAYDYEMDWLEQYAELVPGTYEALREYELDKSSYEKRHPVDEYGL